MRWGWVKVRRRPRSRSWDWLFEDGGDDAGCGGQAAGLARGEQGVGAQEVRGA